MRDENIWLRKYVEAWHRATENGLTSLSWLDPESGPNRHKPTPDEAVDCQSFSDCNRLKTEHCWRITSGLRLQRQGSKAGWVCLNKHRLASEQRVPGWDSHTIQWINTLMLTNARMSSTLAPWSAERVFGRQNVFNADRTPKKVAEGEPFGFHCYKDDHNFLASIAVTDPNENGGWWSAIPGRE